MTKEEKAALLKKYQDESGIKLFLMVAKDKAAAVAVDEGIQLAIKRLKR